MHDPIGSHERIKRLIIKYLDTAFHIADDKIAAERRHILNQRGVLAQEPIIEKVPTYQHA